MIEGASEKISPFRLEGVLGTAAAAGLRQDLLAALEAESAVVLDVGGLERIDLPGLQVLLALFRDPRVRNRDVHLSGTAGRTVLEAAVLFGLTESVPAGTGELESLLRTGIAREDF